MHGLILVGGKLRTQELTIVKLLDFNNIFTLKKLDKSKDFISKLALGATINKTSLFSIYI